MPSKAGYVKIYLPLHVCLLLKGLFVLIKCLLLLNLMCVTDCTIVDIFIGTLVFSKTENAPLGANIWPHFIMCFGKNFNIEYFLQPRIHNIIRFESVG